MVKDFFFNITRINRIVQRKNGMLTAFYILHTIYEKHAIHSVLIRQEKKTCKYKQHVHQLFSMMVYPSLMLLDSYA